MTVTLHQGDCLDLMRNLPDASVDLILCDLPYGTTRNKWDSIIPLDALWSEYKRIARGAVVLTAQTPFDKVLGASNLPWLRHEWIWEKPRATGHLNAKRAPMKAHENVLVFGRSAPTYNPQMTPGKRYHVGGGASKQDNYGDFGTARENDGTLRYPRSVQVFGAEAGHHPTQKPVALMEYLVRTYSNPGDVVLDNCMGSGTTGVACVRAGREFIGMEMDAGYYETARARITAAFAQAENDNAPLEVAA